MFPEECCFVMFCDVVPCHFVILFRYFVTALTCYVVPYHSVGLLCFRESAFL